MKRLIPVSLSLCVLLAFSLLPAQTQVANQAAAPDQITEPVDPAQLQPLPNHHPLWANAAHDLGAASADLTLIVVLQRSPQQEAALHQLLIDQKNPASPDFHHWLTPVEFGQRFGLSDNDLKAVRTWIESQGLTVQWIAPGRNFIGFGGPAVTVGRAFSTAFRNYRVRGDQRTSVSSDPMIPATIAPVVKSIHGLYTIPDKPSSFVTAPQTATPDLTLTDGSHYITPGDFQTLYDGRTTVNGAQQTIGIVGRSRTDSADFTNFIQLTGATFQLPTEVVPTAFGGVDPGPAFTTQQPQGTNIDEQLEATLDVTRAGSIAVSANLLLVVSKQTATIGGIDVDAQYLIQTTPVPAQIINISYGDCETDAGSSGVHFWDTLFQQAAAEGISVFVSSGDSGASGCEASFALPVATPPAISPNYICSSGYATCVGGTEFNDTAANWASSGFDSALGYIPEGGWNEPIASSGTTQLASSGGGVSSIITTPAWQTGPGVPAARTGRYTPDLSFSSSCHDAYFGCLAASGGSCVVTNNSFRFIGLCGTSAAAPSMAGVTALVNAKAGYIVGNINPELYALAQNQPSTFHDTTPASSGVATCDINTPSMCNNSTPGPTGLTGGQAGYPVTVGYDLVTGVGSPDINYLLDNFSKALPGPTVTLTPSAATISPEQALTITVVVAGTTGQPTPTGTIMLSWPTTYRTATLANGTATFAIPAGVLGGAVAPINFYAEYTPDPVSAPVYSLATGTCQVSIPLLTPTVSMSFSPSAPTTAQVVTVTVAVAGGTGNPTPTGGVGLGSGTQALGLGQLSSGTISFTVPAGVLAPGSDQFMANYSPDYSGGLYYTSTSGSANLMVTGISKTTPSVTATPSSSTVTLADSFTVTVKVAGAAAGSPTPTGTATVTGNGHTLSYPITAGSVQFTISPGWLAIGANSLNIAYSGDYNYNPASTTSSITAGPATTSMMVTPSASTLTTAQSLAVSVNILGINFLPAPTGTVTLTSGAYSSGPQPIAGPTVITVSAGALSVGTDVLTATYSGDSNFTSISATTSVVVTAPPPPPPSFSLNGTAVTISAPGATTGNTSTVTVTPANGLIGSVSISAQVTTSPAGAQDPPTVSFGSTSPVTITGPAAGTATLTVTTTAPSTGALVPAARHSSRWLPLGETVLAGILLFGFRARRRRWRAILGFTLLLAAVSGAITACGGGGGSNNPPPQANPGTTPGTYVVTINASAGTVTAATTVNVVVQ